MNYKAIIFDMDGTLLDTLTGIIHAMNKTFEEYDSDTRFTNEDGKYFIGAGAAEFVNRALARANLEIDDIMKFRSVYLSYYEEYQKIETKPFVGLDKVLTKLKEHGYLVGICSNKPQDLLEKVTAQMYPNIKFDTIVGQRVGVPCKPEPQMMEIVKENLKLKSDDILFVGDSEYDYKFASKAKTDCLIVTYGYGIYENDFMNHITYKANNVQELEEMLLK